MTSNSDPDWPDAPTLALVRDRVLAAPNLPVSRRRDLVSALQSYGRITERKLEQIPLDLGLIRSALDGMAPAENRVSPKRWANLRSDLTAAMRVSGLLPREAELKRGLDETWAALLAGLDDKGTAIGLSRFAGWASAASILPQDVNEAAFQRFEAELRTSRLVRNIEKTLSAVRKAWNRVARLRSGDGLQEVEVAGSDRVPLAARSILPSSFYEDLERYLTWCAVPDPLADGARNRRLAIATIGLRRQHLYSAARAALDSGIAPECIEALQSLVATPSFRGLLTQRWLNEGRKLSAYTHGMAGTLIAVAQEWVQVPAATLIELKRLRGKLGSLPSGLTEKNERLLRRFDDPQVLSALARLPDAIWRRGMAEVGKTRRAFGDLQDAIAIDILLHAPLRMQNLYGLRFEVHLHWPQGRGKPALLTLGAHETKTRSPLEFELPRALADRLLAFRNKIAPQVTGARPEHLFVKPSGQPRGKHAISLSIEKMVRRNLGIRLTPHQFRHLSAKIILDDNPGAFELVRQLLGHRNSKTTTNFYAGLNTRRAGKAHAELVTQLRERHAPLARARSYGSSNRRPAP